MRQNCSYTSPPAARLHNPALSLWLSVDPLSDKYPGSSPYVYCGNNPVRLVDVDGREIWIVGEDCNRYRYYKGYLYTENGERYTPESGSFLADATYALDVLEETKTGQKLVGTFEGTDKDVVIQNSIKSECNNLTTDAKTGNFIEQTINWRACGTELETTLGRQSSPITDLGHEFSHVYDNAKGITHLYDLYYQGLSRSEWRATYNENLIRKELGMPLRTTYRFNLTIDGSETQRRAYLLKNGNPYMPDFMLFKNNPL